MSRMTVAQALTQVAATVNQEATSPSVGGDEFNLWLEYLNMSQTEWSQAHEWESTRKFYYPGITGVSLASISLPEDFKMMAAPSKLYIGEKTTPYEYSQIVPENEQIYVNTDLYFKLVGNPTDGFSMVLNPGTLASGASFIVQYFSTPTALSTTTQYLPMADPVFAVEKTISYIFRSRSDPRFQVIDQSANDRLVRMLENENVEKFNNYSAMGYIPTTLGRRRQRIGQF